MKSSLQDLLKKTVIFQFDLPYKHLKRTEISTFSDKCFKATSNNDISVLIYNGIIDYALGECNVNFNDLEKEQVKAIAHYMRYDESDDDEIKEKYGFYGEVMLNLVMQHFLGTRQIIAKGYFYNPMDAQETHGYDAFHFYYNPNSKITSIVLGEAKFRANQSSAIKSAINSLNKVLSVDYLNNNFYAIKTRLEKAEPIPAEIAYIFEKIDDDPTINVYRLLVDNKIKIVYPVLIMCDQHNDDYEKKIESLVNTVNKYVDKINPLIGIDVVIFFIFIPVENTKNIKKEVVKWISERKSLM